MRKLVIVFKEDGTTEVDADGFIGSECVEFTEKILMMRNYLWICVI